MTETPDSEASSFPKNGGGLVSIITRTLNRPVLLARAVESVLGQKYRNWQHVIVNDGGDADALAKALSQYRDRYDGRLIVVNNPKSLGMQAATNAGLKAATGTYIAIHDDDDSWHEDFLAATVSFLEEQGESSMYQGVVTQTVKVWEDIDAQGRVIEASREPYLPMKEITLFRIGYENPFAPIAFVYRRKAHETIGMFDERFDAAGDMDFNVRFLLHWEIGVIGRPLAYYHWRRNVQNGMGNSAMLANVHALRFNEFLNHYLREQAKKSYDGIGLALNIGRHAVTASTRMETALERLTALQEACEIVRQHVESIPGQQSRLADLKAHLTSLTDTLNGDIGARVVDLKAHLTSVSGALETIISGHRAAENSLRNEIDGLRNEVHEWRTEAKARQKGFSIGPIRISWKGGKASKHGNGGK
jgi:glycosyltransferase involved in cell wall biosynthesis